MDARILMLQYISPLVRFLGLFFVIWWLIFLMLLPCYSRRNPAPARGHASSGPAYVPWARLLLYTTAIALLLTSLIVGLFMSGMVSLYDLR